MHFFLNGITAKWNENFLVQDLNMSHHVYILQQ